MRALGLAFYVATTTTALEERNALLSNFGRSVGVDHEDCIVASPHMSFDDYMSRYGRDYASDVDEFGMRQSLFESRQRDAIHHNCLAKHSWSRSVNHLSDRTDDERKMLFGWRHPAGAFGRTAPSFLQVMRKKEHIKAKIPAVEGAFLHQVHWNLTTVNKVKDQGECGSCWAHAAMSLLESHQEIYAGTRHPVQMSMQDFIDCVKNPKKCGGTGGCEGGIVELAVDYAINNVMNTPMRNMYLARDTNDRRCKPRQGGVSMASFGLKSYTTYSNELAPVLLALQSGPVAVAIEANDNWYDYEGGIVDGCNRSNTVVNHAVLLTGYGEHNGQSYWNLLNSWTSNWGENGSLRIARAATWPDEQQTCARDLSPQDGVACEGGPDEAYVCGTCGILYDVVALKFDGSPALRLGSDGLPGF